jgi:hypothetical protein
MRATRSKQSFFRVLDAAVEDRWFLRGPADENGNALDPRVFTWGNAIEVNGVVTIPMRERGPELDFTLADFDMPVVRESIGALIASMTPRDSLQRIPARVTGSRGRFEILNVLDKSVSLDEKRSVIMWWTESDGEPDMIGKYRMVAEMVLDPKSIAPTTTISRLRGWEIALIVRDDLRRALEKVKCSGVRFERLDI